MAFDLASQFKQHHVLQYAVARLTALSVAKANWPVLQSLLLHSIMVEPGVIRGVMDLTVGAAGSGYVMADGRTRIEEVLNLQIERHAPLGHGTEVAWALWAGIALGLKISKGAAAAAVEMDDSVVALLALDADARGLVPSRLSSSRWQANMTTPDLRGPQWLLAYEANVQGWLPSATAGDHVKTDPEFGWLKQLGVHFYDKSRTVPRPRIGLGSGMHLPHYE